MQVDMGVQGDTMKPTTDGEEARMSVRTPSSPPRPRSGRKSSPEREWGLEMEEGPIATLRTFMWVFSQGEGGGNGSMSPVGKDLRNQSIHSRSVY